MCFRHSSSDRVVPPAGRLRAPLRLKGLSTDACIDDGNSCPARSRRRRISRVPGCGDRLRFDLRMVPDRHHAGNGRRPFSDATLNALKNGIFDVPIFLHEPRFCGKAPNRFMRSLWESSKCRRNDRGKSRLNSRVVDLQPTACTALVTL